MWNSIKERVAGLSRETRAQDLLEYALTAAFVAVAVAAVFPTDIAPNISKTFSKVTTLLNQVN